MSAEIATVDVPNVSEHAADQWDARTDPGSVAPEMAWEHAQRVTGVEPIVHADEVRLHQATETLLLRVSGSIMTVLSRSEWRDDVYHAIKHALPENHE